MIEAPIRFDRRGVAGIIVLNRPRTLNVLDLDMLRAMRRTLREWHDDATISAVVIRGEGRAFCAGGDVKAVARRRGDDAFMDEVYRVEYEVDYLLHAFRCPVVPLLHGVTMGGGCGISLHDSHPVAAEDLTLAMPETAIGLFPDVAGSRFLANRPGGVGLFIGLCGARISAADALEFGFIRAIVPKDAHDDLVDHIAAGTPVDDGIAVCAVPPRADLPRLGRRDEIAEHFSGPSALAIVQSLERCRSDWAQEIAALLRRQCPFSLEVTARSIAAAAGRDVRDVLASDFRVAQRLMLRDDYFEGVRALLIDRTAAPRWSPARLEDVDLADVEACFAPLSGPEMWN